MNGKIIAGEKSTFIKVKRGLGEFFFEKATEHGDKICQIDAATGQKQSFALVKQISTRVAVHLRELEISSEDVILFCSRNTIDSVIPVLAALYLGAKIASLDPSQSERDCIHCMFLVKPKLIFVQEDSLKLIENCVLKSNLTLDIIVIGKSEEHKTLEEMKKPSQEERHFRPVNIENCHEMAIIFFSSGTTGFPKGICLSHFGLINSTKNLWDMDYIKTDVMLNYASLYWISAAIMMTVSFWSGGSRLLSQKFEPKNLMQMIEKYKVTYIFMPPVYSYYLTSLENAEKYDTSSVYSITFSGTPLSGPQLLRLRKLFKHTYVSVAYGSTEAGSITTCFDCTKDEDVMDHLCSTGRCVKDMEIKIVDIKSRTLLGPNQRGEICLRTPYAMNGYYKMDNSDVYDDEGFIKMGDVGYYDEDGCIYVVDRIKEMFKYKSWHVVPSSLEIILQEHPAISEAVVFGVPHEMDEFHPAACVVLKNNASVSVADIDRYFRERVSEYQKLRGGIKIVDDIPKTPTGKPQRNLLKHLFIKT